MDVSTLDLNLLRRSFELAALAREMGNLPFASILVDADGHVLLEAQNTSITSANPIHHAELNLVHQACLTIRQEILKNCTVYASSEPCPMCAAAIFWSGIRRVVFGLSTAEKNKLTGQRAGIPALGMSCPDVMASANQPCEVHGPWLETEAMLAHKNFW
jgi:tRNA(Arg) A34 adenosine deaminase TadA